MSQHVGRYAGLIPPIHVVPGILSHPGHGELVRLKPRRQAPAKADEIAPALLIGLLVGILLGAAGVHEWLYRSTDRIRAEAEATNEILVSNADINACRILQIHRLIDALPNTETIERWAEQARAQLPPDVADVCRGGPEVR